MNEHSEPTGAKVRVTDKRKAATAPPEPEHDATVESTAPAPDAEAANYLEDLQRLQAEFDNYRKRVLREQTALTQRASARLIERLLPILDHFEAAVDHGEGGQGVKMVYNDLRKVLSEEGLEEIPADGVAFDPRVHDALEAVEDDAAAEPTCRRVVRRGYRLKDQILRPALVVVARPPEAPPQGDDGAQDAAEG